MAIGLFEGKAASMRTATIKVGDITAEALSNVITPHVLRVVDIRAL